MTDETLKIQVHPDCFKIKDSRIDRQRTGRMSAEAFSLLITPDDPFVLIKDTVYALTEDEFYASKTTVPISAFIENAFKTVMGLESYDMMSEEDRNTIQRIKKDLPHCSACRYKKHKNTVYKIAVKYKLITKEQTERMRTLHYPETTGVIAPTVSALLDHMYKMPAQQRRSCIECVEKHISQAYILGNEVLMGYPEHMPLLCGHLGEALDEMPKDADTLADTLRFCRARSLAFNKPYIPLYAILAAQQLARHAMEGNPDQDSKTEADTTLEIDFTDQMRSDLSVLPETLKLRLCSLIEAAQDAVRKYKESPNSNYTICYEGALACAADAAVNVSQSFANMLRNRRLLFKADIGLALDAGYDFADVLKFLTLGKDADV